MDTSSESNGTTRANRRCKSLRIRLLSLALFVFAHDDFSVSGELHEMGLMKMSGRKRDAQ